MPISLVTAPSIEPLTVAEARRHLQLGDSAGEPAPTAPTVALASPAVAGSCDAGAWRVGLTFVTADGETELGDLSAAVTVADPAVNGRITVTDVALGGVNVTARKVYAVSPGATTARYVGTISNNTATSYTLNIAASGLGVDAPSTNTTADPELRDWITAARDTGEKATQRAWLQQTWDVVLCGFPSERHIELPKPPLISVTWLKYYDTAGTLQTWASSNYNVQAPAGPRAMRGRLELAYGVPWPAVQARQDAVTIRIVCGYGTLASDVPRLLLSAMKQDLWNLYGDRGGREPRSEFVRQIYWSFRAPATQRFYDEREAVASW